MGPEQPHNPDKDREKGEGSQSGGEISPINRIVTDFQVQQAFQNILDDSFASAEPASSFVRTSLLPYWRRLKDFFRRDSWSDRVNLIIKSACFDADSVAAWLLAEGVLKKQGEDTALSILPLRVVASTELFPITMENLESFKLTTGVFAKFRSPNVDPALSVMLSEGAFEEAMDHAAINGFYLAKRGRGIYSSLPAASIITVVSVVVAMDRLAPSVNKNDKEGAKIPVLGVSRHSTPDKAGKVTVGVAYPRADELCERGLARVGSLMELIVSVQFRLDHRLRL
ncbi:MAG: hypothetical protein D6808_05405, partial [Candidatus Dadabacteria bacterium]